VPQWLAIKTRSQPSHPIQSRDASNPCPNSTSFPTFSTGALLLDPHPPSRTDTPRTQPVGPLWNSTGTATVPRSRRQPLNFYYFIRFHCQLNKPTTFGLTNLPAIDTESIAVTVNIWICKIHPFPSVFLHDTVIAVHWQSLWSEKRV